MLRATNRSSPQSWQSLSSTCVECSKHATWYVRHQIFVQSLTAHCFQRINPGKLPSGSEAEAKASASETHNLPIPPNCEGESDWNRIYEKIKEFVGVGPSTNFFVHAAKGDLSAASRTLEFIWKTSLDFNQSTHPRAFALEHLVFELQANAAAVYNMIPYSNKQEACEVMQKRPHTFPHFEASKITGCSFHQKEDVTAFCALTR